MYYVSCLVHNAHLRETGRALCKFSGLIEVINRLYEDKYFQTVATGVIVIMVIILIYFATRDIQNHSHE